MKRYKECEYYVFPRGESITRFEPFCNLIPYDRIENPKCSKCYPKTKAARRGGFKEMPEETKACPFCGCEYPIYNSKDYYDEPAHISCQRCEARGPAVEPEIGFVPENIQREKAIKLWNQRAVPEFEIILQEKPAPPPLRSVIEGENPNTIYPNRITVYPDDDMIDPKCTISYPE